MSADQVKAKSDKAEEKSLESNDPEFSDEQILQDQLQAAKEQGPMDSDEEKLVAAEKSQTTGSGKSSGRSNDRGGSHEVQAGA